MGEFFNLWSLFIQFINVLIIIYLLNRFLFKPYLNYLDEEKQNRKNLEDKVKNIDSLVESAKTEADSIIKTAKTEASSIKQDAISIWKKEWDFIKDSAKVEANQILEKALLDIENERKALETSLKEEAVSLVVKLNQKLFKTSNANKEFVDNMMQEIK